MEAQPLPGATKQGHARWTTPGGMHIVPLRQACELVRQLADFGCKGSVVAGGVGKDGTEAGVKFDGAGRARDLGDIGMADAGSGKDDRVHDDRLLPLIRTNDLRFADSRGAPAYKSQGDSRRVLEIAIHRTPDTGDVVARGGDEFGQFRGALQCGFRAAGSENPRRGGLRHGLEGFAQGGASVEGHWKHYAQAA